MPGRPPRTGDIVPQSKSRKKTTFTPPPVAHAPRTNPAWLVPTMLTLMLGGLVWVVCTYLFSAKFPIPGIGNWNLAVGFMLILSGFGLTMRWQ
jgi:Cell division protein CrgA